MGIEGKTNLNIKTTFDPDKSSCYWKHCQEEQSNFLDVGFNYLWNLACSGLEKPEFLEMAKIKGSSFLVTDISNRLFLTVQFSPVLQLFSPVTSLFRAAVLRFCRRRFSCWCWLLISGLREGLAKNRFPKGRFFSAFSRPWIHQHQPKDI